MSAALPRVPQHLGLIMDGNGRWARQRGLPRSFGHQAGMDNINTILACCVDAGIGYLTVYAFSTENWQRPRTEVQALMKLLGLAIRRHLLNMHRNGVQIRHSGRLEQLHPVLADEVRAAIAKTRHNDRIVLNVAFNYGGRDEIVHAAQRLLADGLTAAAVNETTFRQYLYQPDMPDLDFIIRTGGETRLSNFMLWQAAYAEYYATNTYWPAFGPAQLHEALREYSQRERRFGKVRK